MSDRLAVLPQYLLPKLALTRLAGRVAGARAGGLTTALIGWFVARYGVDTLIHGHTHRPAIHALDVDGRACRRIVLGDWYTQGSVLRVQPDGTAALSALPL